MKEIYSILICLQLVSVLFVLYFCLVNPRYDSVGERRVNTSFYILIVFTILVIALYIGGIRQ